MRTCVIACWLFLWGCGSLLGQSVTIFGQNSSFRGQSIQISIDRNPFITIPNSIEQVVCNDSGHFEHSLELETGTVIQFAFGLYSAYLYVEPEIRYEIELPDYRTKSYAEKISPFFQPIIVPIKVLSTSSLNANELMQEALSLNHKISRFDSAFSKSNAGVIMDRRLGKKSNVDSISKLIEWTFMGDTSPFFKDYRRYKYGVLKLNEGKTGLEEISNHFLGQEVHYSHPGFMELFSAMFKDFIFYYSRTSPGKGLMRHINRTHNIDSIRYYIGQHPAVWNDTLADMVLLQEASSLFYAGNIHKESILILLDSMVLNPISPDFSIYAFQLKEKLASLVIGHPPPKLDLSDMDGITHTLTDFKGKYVYLMFCTPDHYGCMMEYPFLQSFHTKHNEYLEILTVMVAEEESLAKDFMKRNGYGWKALFYEGQPGVLSDYLIKAFPVAYLIGPDGNLVLSPSPLPSDGFEQQLFRIMRSRGEI